MTSTLDPDNLPEPDRQLGLGHGNKALGPSDISDTGSDMQGGVRAVDEPELGLGLDRGTMEDSDTRPLEASDENEDAVGTGEDITAGRADDIDLNGDIGTDRIDYLSPDLQSKLNATRDDLPPARKPGVQQQSQR